MVSSQKKPLLVLFIALLGFGLMIWGGSIHSQPAIKIVLASHQKDLEELLAGNGQERYRKLQADGKQKIQKGQEELNAANKQLADAREKAGQAQTQLTEQSNKLNQRLHSCPRKN